MKMLKYNETYVHNISIDVKNIKSLFKYVKKDMNMK